MADLDEQLGPYRAARTALLEALPDMLGTEADDGPGRIAAAMEQVNGYFDAADAMARTITRTARARLDLSGDFGSAFDDRRDGATNANDEGDQILELIDDAMSVLNDGVVAALGPGNDVLRLIEQGYEPLEFADVVLEEERRDALVEILRSSLPGLARMAPEDLSTFAPDRPGPLFDGPPTAPGSGYLPPVPPPTGRRRQVRDVADHIFDETGTYVGGAVLGGTVSGVLEIVEVGAMITEVVTGVNEGQGSLLQRIVRRAARSVAGWIADLFTVGKDLIGYGADLLVGTMKRLHTALGMPIVRHELVLDYAATMDLLDGGFSASGLAASQANPGSVGRSFDRRMGTLKRGGHAVSLIVALALAAPGSGVVIGLLSSMLAIWLATDHLGVPAGALAGRPNWHHPDLGS